MFVLWGYSTQAGLGQDAEQQLTHVIHLPPSHSDYEEGVKLERKADFKGAVTAFTQDICHSTDKMFSLQTYLRRAQAYRALGEFQKAIDDCSVVIKLASEPVLARGPFQVCQKDIEQQILWATLMHEPGLELARLFAIRDAFDNRGDLYSALGEFGKAADDYTVVIWFLEAEKSRNMPCGEQAYIKRSKAYQALHKLDLAAADQQKAQEHVLWSERKELQDDTAEIRSAPRDARSYLPRGDFYYSHSRYQAAIDDYSKAINLGPAWTKARSGNSDLLLKQAEASLKRFFEATHDGTDYGCLQCGRYTVRGETVHCPVCQTMTAAHAYNGRGQAFANSNQYPTAVKNFSCAIALLRSLAHNSISEFVLDSNPFLNRAAIYEKLGMRDLAKSDREDAKVFKCAISTDL